MPVERVVIELVGDSKKLKSTISDLEKMGAVDSKNARQFEKNNKKFNEGVKKSSKGVSSLSSAIGGIGAQLAAAFTVGAIINFGKQVFEVRAEFQKLEAVLTNTLGDRSAAQSALKGIQGFAARTPFQVRELTQSFVKLVNQGFKPTLGEMRSLGDLASSTGKSFDQLTEAIIDAQTGEFERLKEFGIRAKTEGDRVKFTFKGVTTEVEKTAEAMRGYILALGDAEGVSGSMAAISQTLAGQASNLGDAWERLLNTIGAQTEGVFSNAIASMTDFLEAAEQLSKGAEQTIKDFQAETARENVGQVLADAAKKGFTEVEALQAAIRDAQENIAVNARTLNEELQGGVKWLKEHEELYGRITGAAHIPNQDARNAALVRDLIGEDQALVKVLKEELEVRELAAKKAEELAEKQQLEKNTIIGLKKEVAALTKVRDTAQLGTSAFTKATNDLTAAQLRLAAALGKEDKRLKELIPDKEDIEDVIVAMEELRQTVITFPNTGDAQLLFDNYLDAADEANDKELEMWKRKEEEKRLIFEGTVNFMNGLLSLQATQIQAHFAKELEDLERQKQFELDLEGTTKEKRAAINEKFAEREKQIKIKQAQAEKDNNLFRAVIGTAQAVVNALGSGIPPANFINAALVGAAGAVEIATIAGTPLPKFHKGRDPQASGYGTSIGPNEQLSITRKDEYIMNPEESRRYSKPLKLMKDGRFEKMYEQKLDRTWNNKGSFAENVAAYDGANVVNAINSQTKKGRQDAKMLASKFDKYADPDNLYGW